MTEMVYKILPASAWAEALSLGRYGGSADDLRDGYIHLSTARQLAGTLARHFSDDAGRRPGLVVVTIDPGRLGAALKWEPARDGSLFPHLYAPLPAAAALDMAELHIGPDGRHILPERLARC
ncbi:MAG: DUF952 domain-containing protein [Hyphomicrobiaceae bacterium]